jgi:membrane fusion protein, adhesin transport system
MVANKQGSTSGELDAAFTRKVSRTQMKHLSREAILEEVGASKYAFLAGFLVISLISAAGYWSSLVEITSVAKTQGKVIPTGYEQVVQHLEGGIVRSINVRNGDLVNTGDLLLQFDQTLRQAELSQIRARDASLRIREIRLRAFIDDTEPDFGELGEKFTDQVNEGKYILSATRDRIAGQSAVLDSRINQRRQSVEIFKQQASSLQEQYKLVRESVDMRKKLFKSGHGSRINLINTQLELSRVQGALAESRVSVDQARSAIQEAKNELTELIVTERGTALEALSGVMAERAEVRENLARLEDRVKRLAVIAPASGAIHGLQVNTPGAVIEPAQVLMTIVPLDEKVVVETDIQPEDIGHIAIGQVASVTVSGFDSRRYGIVEGTLLKISPTTFTDEQGRSFFKGRIGLKQNFIETPDARHKVVPGMIVQADILTGSQSLLRYLTTPVYVALFQAFSER